MQLEFRWVRDSGSGSDTTYEAFFGDEYVGAIWTFDGERWDFRVTAKLAAKTTVRENKQYFSFGKCKVAAETDFRELLILRRLKS